jgi:hypothetical protein
MYGLSQDVDLKFLNARQVEQVRIGEDEVIFVFDEDVTITAYSQFGFSDGQKEWTWKPEPDAAQIAARTVSLLGSTIESFVGQENGTLSLAFSNGQRLTFLDSSKEYESYDITRAGSTIMV